MPAATGAEPILLWCPALARLRIVEFHLVTTALAAHGEVEVVHGANSNTVPGRTRRVVIVGIVLAGGASSRMGRPKALLPTGVSGETFVSRLVATFRTAGVDDVVVVTRPGVDLDAALSRLPLPPRVVENSHADRGQLSSLLAGLAVVDRPGIRAIMVTIVDQPLVSVATLAALLEAYRRQPAPIVRPSRGDTHGHPVIFDRSVFDELRQADMSRGAKMVVRAHATAIVNVQVEDDGAFVDVDSPEDYERVFGRPLPGSSAL